MCEEQKRVALTIHAGGQTREVTFDELTLSNNLALEALVRVLVEKKVVDIKELQEAMTAIRKERYRDPSA